MFRNNQSHDGGGLFAWGNTIIINSEFHDNRAVPIDMSGGGNAGGMGGGIACLAFTSDLVQIINCTISRNTGGENGGVAAMWNIQADLRNSIVWGNVATGQDVAAVDAQVRGNVEATYSCVQDLLTPIPGEDPPDPAQYPGCIVTSPQFIAPLAGDFGLGPASPCIDTGATELVPADVTEDLSARARIVIGGGGTIAVVDMGAREFGSWACAPSFGEHPAGVEVNVGGVVSLAAGASPADGLAWSWRRDGVALIDGPTGLGSIMSGAQTSNLVVTNVQAADTGTYEAVVTSACGQAVSVPAFVRVGTETCPVDWNGDGSVGSADITAFLAAWFTDLAGGTLVADYDHSGTTGSADITGFLSDWFAALQGGC